MSYHRDSQRTTWHKKRQGQNVDPKGKKNNALGQNGGTGRGNQFLNKHKI